MRPIATAIQAVTALGIRCSKLTRAWCSDVAPASVTGTGLPRGHWRRLRFNGAPFRIMPNSPVRSIAVFITKNISIEVA